MKRWPAFLTFLVLFLSIFSFPKANLLTSAEGAPVSVPSGTVANDFVFESGRTYLVTGPTVMTGVVTIEGNAVIKFDDAVTGAALDIANPVFKTTSSNWAIFTSKHDNTVGETVAGSTGTPIVSQYTNALTLGATAIRFVQVRYAGTGIAFSGSGTFSLRDSEFFATGTPVSLSQDTDVATLELKNLLVAFGANGPVVADDGVHTLAITSNNLTFYSFSGSGFNTTLNTTGSTFSVTDSLFLDIQGASVFAGTAPDVEDFNAFFLTPQNGSGANDIVLTADPIVTDFFLDQTSPLIDAGSRTATAAGLYHHTTNTDKTREANTTVDIGYHVSPDLTSFSILATNSIWLKKNSMSTGDIGVSDVTPGPWVNTQAQLVVGKSVVIPAEISLFADSIKIKNNAVINGSVFTNQLTNNGTINGTITNPLALPLFDLLPVFRSAVIGAGASDIEVANGQEVILAPGEYGDIIVNKNGILKFSGGVYHIRSIEAKKFTSLSFEAASEIRIQQTLSTKKASFVGPTAGSNLNAEDIQFFIEGTDDGSVPRTAKFGQSNTVTAHLYVSNGTIWLKKDTVASGAFFGKNVIVGQNTDVSEETGTSNPEVAAPIITPNGGSFFDSVSVNLSTITTGASIHYTLDGTTPTAASTLFTGLFNLTSDTTVNAIAVRNGFIDSAVTTADFIVQPTPQVDLVTFDPSPDTFQNSVDVTLSTTTPGATIHYTLNGTTPTTSSPVFSTPITLTEITTVTAFAVKLGFINSAITSAEYTIETGPPDPSTVAPPLDDTLIANVASNTEFLYTGANPIQTGVAPGTIEARRGAVVRGKVLSRDGTPLPGATITILNHPEFGQTESRSDGFFDMAVNGGGQLIVNYQLLNFLPAQRKVDVPWQDYAVVDDVALVALDSQVTPVDLSAITQITAAQGSVVTDSDGTRQATLLFTPGTTAEMIVNGVPQPITTLNVRATEFTVGLNGPMAMPAKLPPNTAYTYASEFSIDEAIAAGATSVNFSQPVYGYLENFLNFPTGINVPSGSYDRIAGKWIPEASGKVIEILSITGGLADLDTNGDALPDDATILAALNITDDERTTLASQYTAGQTLWRVPLDHFTIYDWNWPLRFPADAESPMNDPAENAKESTPNNCNICPQRSFVQVEGQILGETIPVTGTPFSLTYVSDRVRGNKDGSKLKIPLIGSSFPTSLLHIDLTIDIAGQRFESRHVPSPDLSTDFLWDGLDAYGREVPGTSVATVKIGYAYEAVYGGGQTFAGQPSEATFGPTRLDLTVFQEYRTPVNTTDFRALGLGGWNLDQQHFYDPFGQVLHLGDGTRRSGESLNNVITSVIGGGAGFGLRDIETFGPLDVRLGGFAGPAVADEEGNVYVSDTVVARLNVDGTGTLVAGGGPTIQDNVPALNTKLDPPRDLALDSDGNLYIVDSTRCRVRKVGTDDIIRAFAGNSSCTVSSGDGGLATSAGLKSPSGITVDSQGNLYIAESNAHRVRKVDTNGIITTFAGTGAVGFSGDGGLATQAKLIFPQNVAVDKEDNVYIADAGNARIRKVNKEGIITTVVGNGQNDQGTGIDPVIDGAPATQSGIGPVGHLAFDREGNMYFTDFWRMYVVNTEGILNVLGGQRNQFGFNADNIPVKSASLDPDGITVDPAGNVYVVDRTNGRLRKVAPPLPEFNQQGFQLVAEDGSEVYGIDFTGRHLQTVNALTGATVWQFAYDASGQLSSVTDGDGDVTTIQRDGNGNPTAILSADGQTTILALDANGYLSGITNPANETNLFLYSPDGLMTKRTDPRLNDSIYTYNALGRLTQDADPAGGSLNLNKTGTNENYIVTNTTALGRVSSFSVETLQSGGKNLRTTTDTSGLSTTTLLGTDQSQTVTTPDGTQTVITSKPDPRFGMQGPSTNLNVTTPGGLVSNLTTTRSVTLSNPADPLSLTSQTDTTSFNGRTIQSIFDKPLNTMTNISPEGRQFANVFDDQGRVSKEIVPEIADRSFEPDLRGRLSAIRQGTGASERLNTVSYNPQGFVDSLTDPLGRSNRFEYDSVGRVTKQILPDLREIVSTYDAEGNVASITPPGRPAHTFEYTPVNLESVYTPPNVGLPQHATNFMYNVDRQLTQITRPDGKTVIFGYDTGGRRASVQIPRGLTSYGYNPLTGQLTTITAPDSGTLSFAYDGRFRLSSTWAGTVSGTVSRIFNTDQQIASRSVNGANTISFTYDQDELITQAGALNLQYNANNRLVSGSTLGLVADNVTYNEFGEVETYTSQVNAASVFSQQFIYDKLGRIVEKTETVQGITHVFTYVYNSVEFLTQVWRDGILISQYNYDSNGNRAGGTYDNQDRLLTFGSATYTYTANGELLTKTDPSGTTTYNYDVLGNLVSVTLPSGNVIEYIYDGQNRRIGKKVDGVLEKAWLYKDGFNQIAELDGSGNVVSRFVYGTRNNVPAYMIKGGNTYRIVTDILGSPRMVIDTATGVAIQSMDYDEWGNVLTDTNPEFQPFGFAGGLYDTDTKLVQFGFRDYDANTGRWTTKDPIRFEGNDTNLYGYVLNDPINLTDPLGLYGTKSCKLYDDLADRYGGFYFKTLAPAACNTFPEGETTDKSHLTNWSNCMRQCLQERAVDRQFCTAQENTSKAIFDDHISCGAGCVLNPENPYNPDGPDLPDGDLRLPQNPLPQSLILELNRG